MPLIIKLEAEKNHNSNFSVLPIELPCQMATRAGFEHTTLA